MVDKLTCTADCLIAHRSKLIDRWSKSVQNDSSLRPFESSQVLLKKMPEIFESIISSISPRSNSQKYSDSENEDEAVATTTSSHLSQISIEYSIFRRVILDFLEEEGLLNRLLRDDILLAIDRSLLSTIQTFTEKKADERRAELDESLRTQREVEQERDNIRRAVKELQTEFDLSRNELHSMKEESLAQRSFVSTLTHDLRNPIAAVKMALDLLLPTVETNEVDELTELIYRNLDKADRMIRDLLDTHRIKSGEPLPLILAECDLAAIVKRILKDLSTFHGDHFVFQGEKELIGYWSCFDLERVVENLVGNAIKYGSAKTPITVTLTRSNELATLSVHNFGPSVPLKDQDSVFDSFFRSNDVESATKKGWGIGLTLVRGVVEAHGGKAEVRSHKDEGTTFTIILPLDSRNVTA